MAMIGKVRRLHYRQKKSVREIARLTRLIEANEKYYEVERRKAWLNLRDKYAIAALPAVIECGYARAVSETNAIAKQAFAIAEAMIAAREPKEES